MRNNKSDIRLFWHWFSAHQNDLGDKFENKEMLSEIDKRLANLGVPSWEFGPGSNGGRQLVISPGGDLNLFELTNEIISLAPTIEDWEFYSAKQPKEWSLQFNISLQSGTTVMIEGSFWSYVILKYEDGAVEIIMQSPNIADLDTLDKLTAGEILLDGILGEENRIRWFQFIDVVDEFDEDYIDESQNISHLSAHFR